MSHLDRFKRFRSWGGRAETDAEQALWSNLDRIPLNGTHFRRQVEIGPYRLDFGCLTLKLLIEIDGPVHDEVGIKQRDDQRTAWLENEGYRVIRFSNHRVTTDMNPVVNEIKLAAEEQMRLLNSLTHDHPTPALARRPSPQGEGEETPDHA